MEAVRSGSPHRGGPSAPSAAEPGVCTTSAAVTASTAAPMPASVRIARCSTRLAGSVTVSGRRNRERTRRRLRSATYSITPSSSTLPSSTRPCVVVDQRGGIADEPQRLHDPRRDDRRHRRGGDQREALHRVDEVSQRRGPGRRSRRASPGHRATRRPQRGATTSTGTPTHGQRCDDAWPAKAQVAKAATASAAASGQRARARPGATTRRARATPRRGAGGEGPAGIERERGIDARPTPPAAARPSGRRPARGAGRRPPRRPRAPRARRPSAAGAAPRRPATRARPSRSRRSRRPSPGTRARAAPSARDRACSTRPRPHPAGGSPATGSSGSGRSARGRRRGRRRVCALRRAGRGLRRRGDRQPDAPRHHVPVAVDQPPAQRQRPRLDAAEGNAHLPLAARTVREALGLPAGAAGLDEHDLDRLQRHGLREHERDALRRVVQLGAVRRDRAHEGCCARRRRGEQRGRGPPRASSARQTRVLAGRPIAEPPYQTSYNM